jgi:hypothetical protein
MCRGAKRVALGGAPSLLTTTDRLLPLDSMTGHQFQSSKLRRKPPRLLSDLADTIAQWWTRDSGTPKHTVRRTEQSPLADALHSPLSTVNHLINHNVDTRMNEIEHEYALCKVIKIEKQSEACPVVSKSTADSRWTARHWLPPE